MPSIDLSTPTTRRRLKAKKWSRPHWRFISKGRYLGYRRHQSSDAGSWCARVFLSSLREEGKDPYRWTTLATADDKAPADGETVLDYRQALDAAMEWCEQQERQAKGLAPRERGPYTVERAGEDYLRWYKGHRKGFPWARGTFDNHILPALGRFEVAALTSEQIRGWHLKLAKMPPRVRSKDGEGPQFREIEGEDGQRQRKATANKSLTLLKAALNMAYREGRVTSDAAWRRVTAFRGVDAPRVRHLETEEVTRLLTVCEPDFRSLVQGALLTGCRYGELCRLTVGDFLPEVGAVQVRASKGGSPREIFLSEEGAAFFESLTAGRPGRVRLFLREDGEPWQRSHQCRRVKLACEAAGIEPAINFHILRHTYASHYLMNGGSLEALAKQLGHADTRMTLRHYGHLAQQWRAENARSFAPSFGVTPPRNVVRMQPRRRPNL